MVVETFPLVLGAMLSLCFLPPQIAEDEGVDEVNPTAEREAEMGTRLEAFNLSRELEEGRYDREGGTFTFDRKEELQQVTDRWLDEVDAGTSEAKMTAKNLAKMRENNEKLAEDAKRVYDPKSLLRELFGLLGNTNETPNAAMRRLGGITQGNKRSRDLLPHERKARKAAAKKAEEEAAAKKAEDTQNKPKGGESRVFDAEWGTWKKKEQEGTTSTSTNGGTRGMEPAAIPAALKRAREQEDTAGPQRRKLDATQLGIKGVDRISELCNLLLELGHFEIYDTPQCRLLPADAVDPVADKKEKVDELLADLEGDSDDEPPSGPSGPGPAVLGLSKATSPVAKAAGAGPAAPPPPPQLTEREGPFFQYVLNGQTYGPFPARQMLAWTVLFKGKGLQVRNCSLTNQPLEDSWRKFDDVDFALYA